MRFGSRTENERVRRGISLNSGLDLQVVDQQMNHKPNWRRGTPKNKKRFKLQSKSFTLQKDPAWKQHAVEHPKGFKDQYSGGLNNIEQKFYLEKEKESKKFQKNPLKRFISMVKPTVGETNLIQSNSMRTRLVDKVMKILPRYEDFSSNKTLKHYKKSLIQTGNVDGIIPFVHSNNKNAEDLLHMRPDYPKTYPKSTLNMLNRKDVQNNFDQLAKLSKVRRSPAQLKRGFTQERKKILVGIDSESSQVSQSYATTKTKRSYRNSLNEGSAKILQIPKTSKMIQINLLTKVMEQKDEGYTERKPTDMLSVHKYHSGRRRTQISPLKALSHSRLDKRMSLEGKLHPDRQSGQKSNASLSSKNKSNFLTGKFNYKNLSKPNSIQSFLGAQRFKNILLKKLKKKEGSFMNKREIDKCIGKYFKESTKKRKLYPSQNN